MKELALQLARLIILQLVLLVMGILFLLTGRAEGKYRFNKVADYIVGILLLVLCYITMRYGV